MSAVADARAREPDIGARIQGRRERVHILTGAVCNNNCIFCMEEDRDARYVTNSATTDETVRAILGKNRGAEEVCFTSGEPTINPRLPHLGALGQGHGAARVSVMTNGRALSYEKYADKLVAAGMNRFYVSIHGHTAKLHEGLTRTPDSFEQTVAGIEVIARFKRYGIELHTSTVLTKRNLPHMAEIYRFLRELGVDQVVFNVMQANGRANTFFEQIFPRYTEIAAEAGEVRRRGRATRAAGRGVLRRHPAVHDRRPARLQPRLRRETRSARRRRRPARPDPPLRPRRRRAEEAARVRAVSP